jgi:hypothetical protein
MSGKLVRTTPSMTPQTCAIGSLYLILTPSWSRMKLLAPSPLNRYFARTVSDSVPSTCARLTSTGYTGSLPSFLKPVIVHGLCNCVPLFSMSSMKTRSIRPWWRSVVNGYRASMNFGQLAQVPVRWMPFEFGSQKATSYTFAGSCSIIFRLRPIFRRRSNERG